VLTNAIVFLMASPKFPLQEHCNQGQWNMRTPSDGGIPEGSLKIKRLTLIFV
jgi:hypothetical protein